MTDYGMGVSNIDQKTGIRYGVISMHEVTQIWCDESEEKYEEEDGTDYGDVNPISYFVLDDEYEATQDADDTDIFIIKSPYYTVCKFCSPCAPGAGFIMDSDENGIKAYCFGHDWFDQEKAPYPVYSVETDEVVKPEAE